MGILDELKSKISGIKDKAVKEFINEQLYILRDNVMDFVDEHTPKSKSRRGKKAEPSKEADDILEKLSEELYVLRSRLQRVSADSYKELSGYTRIKVSRIVDTLEKLVLKDKIGANQYNALVIDIENTFNSPGRGADKEFSMDNVRKAYDKLLYTFIDELNLKERQNG